MGVPLPDPLPSFCPSCGEAFSVEHALRCKKGAWVARRHREITIAWKDYFKHGGASLVALEPVLPPLPAGAIARPTTTTDLNARSDIRARGLTVGYTGDEYFDIACLDTGAQRYDRQSSIQALTAYEGAKDAKYLDRVSPLGRFTPLVCSVYGALAPRAASTAHRVARRVDPDREEQDAVVDLHAVVLQTAIIKAASLGLRARSATVLPPVTTSRSTFEDASSCLAGARGGES
jgi:hypothetical protein